MTKGRRLRLDRRKAGLSQQELADKLGHTLEEISAMENDRLEPSTAAQAFCANVPVAPRKGKARATPKPAGPQKAEEQRLGSPEEAQEGPGPRVEVPDGDRPPAAAPSRERALAVPRGDIAELEDALLKMFGGERLIVPKQTPEGTIQVEAVIPGIAQLVGMYDEFDGQILETYSPGMAKAWAELARVNPMVRKILMGLTYGGAYRGVMAASLPPLFAILMHHGAMGRVGGPAPVVQQAATQPQPEPEAGVPHWNGGVPPETQALFDEGVGFDAHTPE